MPLSPSAATFARNAGRSRRLLLRHRERLPAPLRSERPVAALPLDPAAGDDEAANEPISTLSAVRLTVPDLLSVADDLGVSS